MTLHQTILICLLLGIDKKNIFNKLLARINQTRYEICFMLRSDMKQIKYVSC